MYTTSGDSHVKLVFRKVKKMSSSSSTSNSSSMVTALAQVSSNLLVATQNKPKSTKRNGDNRTGVNKEEEEEVTGRLFLWRHSDRVVISDIDGTITMSDVRGHLLTRLGKDWVHEGVCSLYDRIASNGYRLLYLTARPATMAGSTSQFIEKIRQQTPGDGANSSTSDKQQRQTTPPRFHTLPPGPVITAYNSTRNAFLREVVLRRPEAFKIYILRLIRDAFEPSAPFVCGLGNRVTDDLTYERVGVPKDRIFRINTGSRITTPLLSQGEGFRTFHGYSEMEMHIGQLFPPC